MATSLFEKYGGFGNISKIVMIFYDRVLDSEIMAPYFAHVDMPGLIDHQTKFIASIMGGPASYTNEALRKIHAPHMIERAAFDEMGRLLSGTLSDAGMEPGDVALVMEEIEKRAIFVVSPGGAS